MIRFRSFMPVVAAVLVGAATLAAPTQARADVEIGFVNNSNSRIVFNPLDPGAGFTGSFSFVNASTPAGQPTIVISDGTAEGLLGNITGTYNIGAITTAGTAQTALVTNGSTGPHQFLIYEGNVATFTADVAWIDIKTDGTFGGINVNGDINITNISYTGSNADLLALEQGTGQYATISFQVSNTKSLTTLTSNTGTGGSSTFSGTIYATAVPEPAAIGLAMSAAPCLIVWQLVRRRKGRGLEAA